MYTGGGLSDIPPEAIRAQAAKILSSPGFVAAGRMRRFLSLAVEHAVSGDSAPLKEYRIALDVFDRDDSFDPRADPIVRVEARRLRSKLKEYYEGEGAADSIRIDIP